MADSPSYALDSTQGVPGFGAPVKASVRSTAGAFSLIDSRTTGGAPWHVHANEDEFFYVIEGLVRVRHGTRTSDLGPGGFVFLPRGEPHAWDVVTDEARLLLATVPAMLESFLEDFHAAADGAGREAVARRYGVTFLPPDFEPSASS